MLHGDFAESLTLSIDFKCKFSNHRFDLIFAVNYEELRGKAKQEESLHSAGFPHQTVSFM